ncbi:uncharacterized protein LOC141849057 [Brevipalpus obovatus]|uniref:uncharacterized protein LOC141849057 n=1 Tax=Brevipalpus obovatus TaxID=246614 RepID=UPI003D9E7049
MPSELNQNLKYLNRPDFVEKLIRVLPNESAQCPTCTYEPDIEHVHYLVDEGSLSSLGGIPQLKLAQCSVCERSGVRLYTCSDCNKNDLYCGKKCQKDAYPKHSSSCGNSPISHDAFQKSNGTSRNFGIEDPSPNIIPASTNRNLVPRQVELNRRIQGDTSDNGALGVEFISTKPQMTITIGNPSASGKDQLPTKPTEKPAPSDQVKPLGSITIPPPEDLKEGSAVVVSSFDSPDALFLQNSLHVDAIGELTSQLTELIGESKLWPEVDQLRVGNFCAALFHEDGQWYRARVLKIDQAKALFTVEFIDFGNVQEVRAFEIQPLPAKFCQIPLYVYSCSLQSLKPVSGEEWPDTVDGVVNNMLEKYSLNRVRIFSKEGGRYFIDITDKSSRVSLVEEMIKAKIASRISDLDDSSVEDCPKVEAEVAPSIMPKKPVITKSPTPSPTPPQLPIAKEEPTPAQLPIERELREKLTPEPEPQPQPPLKNEQIVEPPVQTIEQVKSSENPSSSKSPGMSLRKQLAKKAAVPTRIPSVLEYLEKDQLISGFAHLSSNPEACEYFVLFQQENLERLCDLQAIAQEKNPANPEVKKGDFVSVNSSVDDEDPYRGEVIEVISDEKIRVLLIDHGFVDVVDKWCKIDDELLKIPALVLLMRGTDVPNFLRNHLKKQIAASEPDPVEMVFKLVEVSDGRASAEGYVRGNKKIVGTFELLSSEKYRGYILERSKAKSPTSTENGDSTADFSSDLKEHSIAEEKKPHKTTVEPVKTIVEPQKTIVQPQKAAVDPAKSIAEPQKATVEPVKTIVEPSKTVVEPKIVQDCQPKSLNDFKHLIRYEQLTTKSAIPMAQIPNTPTLFLLANSEALFTLDNIIGKKEPAKLKKVVPGTFALWSDGVEISRVLIIETTDDKDNALVYFLDVGGLEGEVPLSTLSVLDEEIHPDKVPALAVRCEVTNWKEMADFQRKVEKRIESGKRIKFEIESKVEDGFYKIKMSDK